MAKEQESRLVISKIISHKTLDNSLLSFFYIAELFAFFFKSFLGMMILILFLHFLASAHLPEGNQMVIKAFQRIPLESGLRLFNFFFYCFALWLSLPFWIQAKQNLEKTK